MLQSTTFHITLTATIRQNATKTPGDSARFTSVELSENATTSPTTASTPSVFALSARIRIGVSDNCPAARGPGLTGAPYAVRLRRESQPRSAPSTSPTS
ncbi:MAG TPA: hypothetical protein VK631_25715, partial [Solirubrobacteraceae bacterium]|nr:hypothetical protein [Solirubrobacteraceae bacterium]